VTIRFTQVWNGYQPDQVVSLSSSEEARLVSLGYATADIDGPVSDKGIFSTDSYGSLVGIRAPDGSVFPMARTFSLSGALKHFSAGGVGGSGITLQNQIPPPADATGFRAVYTNGTTSSATITTAKAAVTSADGHTGASLTYTSLTFDGAATATLAAATGTAPQDVRSMVVSDHVSLPVAADKFAILRTYFASTACAEQIAAGEMLAFRNATGLKYKTCSASGVIADTAVCGTVQDGQIIIPASLIWTFPKETITVATVGGSNNRGQGSSGNATGLVYRSSAALSNSARVVTPFIGAVSGQGTIASLGNAKQIIEKIRPRILFLLLGSGNDSITNADDFAAMKGRTAAIIEHCSRFGVIPIVGTMAPANLSAEIEALRIELNQWGRNTVRNMALIADIARKVENPSNVAQLLPAYNSGDNVHWNDAGHAAAAEELTAAIRYIIG
jgi:hypothetical protein